MKLMIRFILLFGLMSSLVSGMAQADSSYYKVHIPLEGSLALGGFGATSLLFPRLYHVSTLRENDVIQLDRNDVNAFDRPVINVDPAGFDKGQRNSDLWLNISVLSPFTLLLDKQIRKDWGEFLVLYVETQMINTSVYQAAAFSVRRERPLTYNQTLAASERTGEQRSNSFYSGHVSTAATGMFFMAKVYTDYHDIKGWSRIGIYSAAAVPPALVGYHRIQAGKHFKSDIIMGYVTGAAIGILVPELHKRLRKKDKKRR